MVRASITIYTTQQFQLTIKQFYEVFEILPASTTLNLAIFFSKNANLALVTHILHLVHITIFVKYSLNQTALASYILVTRAL